MADAGSLGGGISPYLVSCFGGAGGTSPGSFSTRVMLLLLFPRFQLRLSFRRIDEPVASASVFGGDLGGATSRLGDLVNFCCALGPFTLP